MATNQKTTKKPPLKPNREKWAKARPGKAIKGTPLNYNAAIEVRYSNAIKKLVRQMSREAKKELAKIFETQSAEKFFSQDAAVSADAKKVIDKLKSRFDQLFNSKANGLARGMISDADRSSATNLGASLKQLSGGLSLNTKAITAPMKQILSASVQENVSLIKSIPQNYMAQVEGAVMRSITTGNGLEDLIPFLDKYQGVTSRRATNIALDQTRKAYSNLNKGRMEAIGVQEYEWIHSGGGQHPRPLHISMSGNIYRFDDPPVIDLDTGETGIPGQAINCRCTMRPIVRFDEGDQSGANSGDQ